MLLFRCFSPAAAVDASDEQREFDRSLGMTHIAKLNNINHSHSAPTFAPPQLSQSSSLFPASKLDSSTWESSEPDTLLSASTKRLRRVQSQVALERSLTQTSTAEQQARFFANCYLEAVAAGDGKWASAAISKQFSEQIVLVAPDGQKFEGKVSVVARLNRGVDQLTRMSAATDKSSIQTKFDLQPLIEEGGGGLVTTAASSSKASFIKRISSRLIRKQSPLPLPPVPILVNEIKFRANYEWRSEGSARSFRIKDVITVSNGLITFVQRSMNI